MGQNKIKGNGECLHDSNVLVIPCVHGGRQEWMEQSNDSPRSGDPSAVKQMFGERNVVDQVPVIERSAKDPGRQNVTHISFTPSARDGK